MDGGGDGFEVDSFAKSESDEGVAEPADGSGDEIAADAAGEFSSSVDPWTPPVGMISSPPIACLGNSTGKPPGVFTEIGVLAGFDFNTPAIWPKNSAYPDADVRVGTGIALADFNGDGLIDMYIPEATGKHRIYLAVAPWKYVCYDVESKTIEETAALAADFDGDGGPDLVVSGNSLRVQRNDGPSATFGIKFNDMTVALGVDKLTDLPSEAAASGEVDRDG